MVLGGPIIGRGKVARHYAASRERRNGTYQPYRYGAYSNPYRYGYGMNQPYRYGAYAYQPYNRYRSYQQPYYGYGNRQWWQF